MYKQSGSRFMMENTENLPLRIPRSGKILICLPIKRAWFGTLPLQMLIVPSLWQAYVDKAFNNEILALDVKCKNNEWGCKWEGEFQNYQVSYADCVLLILANKNNFKARNRLCYKHWLRVLINASCWRLFKCFLYAW